MNKLQGFLELRKSGLPSVPWEKFCNDSILDDNLLWTVRSAVQQGNDLNLPRKVGVSSEEATKFAKELINSFASNDMVIYYPYFVAIKSGVIDVSSNKVVIEAVSGDLWNLVTFNNKDVTIISTDNDLKFIGNSNFLTTDELLELADYSTKVRRQFQQYLLNGKSVFLEWSYACKADRNGSKLGEPSLVFYEIRTV